MNLENYIQVSGPLFEAVERERLFADAKTFVDAYPLENPQDVLKDYFKEKDRAGFDLIEFVSSHFAFPKKKRHDIPKSSSMTDHISLMWDILQKDMTSPSPYSTLIALPKPHIVPGGRFRECFYWDSYFTALGLAVSGEVESIKDMVENFAYLIDKFGFIPNGNRIYFTSRTQPPYFSFLLTLLLDHVDEEWVLSFMPQLETEYNFWMEGAEALSEPGTASHHVVRLDENTLLNRYYDKLNTPRPEAYLREIELAKENPPKEFFRNMRAVCSSGWDFSSRWFADPKDFQTVEALDIVPIDLNCLLHHLEITLADFANRLNDTAKAKHYQSVAELRKEAIQRIFWNDEEQFYFDYNFKKQKQTKSWSLAAATPLFSRLASLDQAQAVGKHLEDKFLFPGGFTTTLYEGIHQWDKPNGWAPLQWITIKGLQNYGMDLLAKEGAKRWIQLNRDIYTATGKMLEKYNVLESSSAVARGEYTLQEGFGWTNGVALALIDIFDK
ncbi:MAG: alpha,alpha-trehalase TreF [Simkania sp.]|nr:alpha,alpha-trehalase TreF [Simkania sp.]MCP5490293.1 alpha,alpha-trehalase TreF [Chlamydiales bacterium]